MSLVLLCKGAVRWERVTGKTETLLVSTLMAALVTKQDAQNQMCSSCERMMHLQ